MSPTLFVLVPIGMLAIVWSVCFVGCVFHTGGLASPYSNTILEETSLVAYWPLSDLPGLAPAPPPQGSTGVGTAVDLSGNGHTGSYIVPPAYPTGTTIPQIGTNPMLNLHQASIVPGDAFTTGSKNCRPASISKEVTSAFRGRRIRRR